MKIVKIGLFAMALWVSAIPFGTEAQAQSFYLAHYRDYDHDDYYRSHYRPRYHRHWRRDWRYDDRPRYRRWRDDDRPVYRSRRWRNDDGYRYDNRHKLPRYRRYY